MAIEFISANTLLLPFFTYNICYLMDFGEQAVLVSRVLQGQQEAVREAEAIEGERRVGMGSCAKLGYQRLFYQSQHGLVEQRRVEGNHIAVMRVGGEDRSSALQAFYSNKEIHEKGIRRFKAQYCSEQQSGSRRRRRGYSIDSEATGAYYLNNWLSSEDYFCEKPPPEERTAHLVYDLLDRRWSKALQAVASCPKSAYSAPLEYILNGFKAVCSLLVEEDRQLAEHFMGRPAFQVIAMKLSSDSVGGNGSFVNVFEEDARARFHQIRSLPRKVEILRTNFDYLVRFAGAYRPAVQDGYLQLAFKLLGNAFDQEGGSVPPQHDYMRLLLKLDIRLSDRLNFAAKLLGERRRREFCGELQQKLAVFPRLDNILYYTVPPISRGRDERIELICREYLDEQLDLETVAGLALQFPCLRRYLMQFRQALQLAGQQGQLERFENCKWSMQGGSAREEERRGRRAASFLECVSVAEERIGEWKGSAQAAVVCEICCKKMLKEDSLLECGKCRHGGHVGHLVKWFEEYENCPHIGCPCLCN